MPINIFSTYSTPENRVTASILAVLKSLALQRTERLLGALLERSDFELVRFENQPAKGGEGVPDAMILSSIRLLVETKIKRNDVDLDQLKRHLKRLDEADEAAKLLLVITPDEQCPRLIDELNDLRLAWTSFAALDQAIGDLILDVQEVISEREEFLLRELQAMLVNEELVSTANDVVVVAARDALPEYLRYHAYVCQPDRAFQQVQRMAFYTQGQIDTHVPRILTVHDHVELTAEQHDGELNALIQRLLVETPRRVRGQANKVIFLSAPDSPDTIALANPVLNDLKKNGRTIAFTQSQRYTSLERLRLAKKTSELVAVKGID
ncbi:MAG: hypothetical protein SH868_15495 [Bythopirellula sp.]|nr:hypothetical protein [Bythopirellula sp.]